MNGTARIIHEASIKALRINLQTIMRKSSAGFETIYLSRTLTIEHFIQCFHRITFQIFEQVSIHFSRQMSKESTS